VVAKLFVCCALVLATALGGYASTLPDRALAMMPERSLTPTDYLGLDLQGGSYLIVETDIPGVVKERLETLRTDIRTQFRRERISYNDLFVTKDGVSLHIADAKQTDTVHKLLSNLASLPGTSTSSGLGTAEYDLIDDGQGNFTLKMTDAYRGQLEESRHEP
jgi:preprotein translocase subunit SecD